MEAILLVIIVVLLILKIEKHEYFMVELRSWKDGTMTNHARNYSGYDKRYFKNTTLRLVKKDPKGFTLHHSNGGIIRVNQTIFTSLDAARVYFETLKPLSETSDTAIQIDLWRVVGRTRKSARIYPPASYSSREAVSLARYQPHFPPR